MEDGFTFDIEDLKQRTDELARFIEDTRIKHGLNGKPVIAAGYSNGANIASSLILRHPGELSGAVLFRAMVPFTPDVVPKLNDLPIFLGAGRQDPIVPGANTQRLSAMYKSGGALVYVHWHEGGHELGQDDLDAAKAWISRQNFQTSMTTGQ
jgi:predicted esterase